MAQHGSRHHHLARPTATGVWIADLRFGETREWNTKKNSVDARPAFSWQFTPKADGDRLRMLRPDGRDVKTMLAKMAGRIFGDRAPGKATRASPAFRAVSRRCW